MKRSKRMDEDYAVVKENKCRASSTLGIKYPIKRECFPKKEGEFFHIDWEQGDQAETRPTYDYGIPECTSAIKKPFVKTDDILSSDNSIDDLMMINKSSENDDNDDDETIVTSDNSIDPNEIYNDYGITANFTSENCSSSSESTNDQKQPDIMTLQTWLKLPSEEYSINCANTLPQNIASNILSDDNDEDDHENSDTESHFAVQQIQKSQTQLNVILPHSSHSSLQNDPLARGIQLKPIDQLIEPSNFHRKKIEKRMPVAPKVKMSDNSKVRRKYTRKRHGVAVGKSDDDSRRITRSLIRSIEDISPNKNLTNQIGKFVWGYCNGWWPAIIVAAEDGGLEAEEDKVCVYWIAEDLISLLNEKTQIESFSINLNIRLIRYLRNDEQQRKDRRKACFVTLKLFSKYLDIPLLKPYVTWATKNLMGKNHLNDVRFYPLPENIRERLQQLKKQNAIATNKIIEERDCAARLSNESSPSEDSKDGSKKRPRGKFPKDLVRKSANENLLKCLVDPETLPLIDQIPGAIVWGKIAGHSWWPGMILHNNDCGKKEPNYGCQWILWYGDYQLSQVHYLNVMKFEERIKKMHNFITQCKRDTYVKAVLNACKDHCVRLGYDTRDWNMDDVLTWVSNLTDDSSTSVIASPDNGSLESRYSSHIAQKLKEMRSNQEIDAERENRIQNCDLLAHVLTGRTDILNILCIICLKMFNDGLVDHPFFKCSVCKDCVEDIKSTVFAYGEDGKCFYCTLCTGADTIVMCDSNDCPRVYCTTCLKHLLCPNEYNDVLLEDPWFCFLCKENNNLNETPIFEPRLDWKIRLGQLFHTNQDTSWNEVWRNNAEARKIRVLSLFDGISTGFLVLQKLGIDVEDYYASEIDSDAELVSAAHFGDKIYRLGDVRNIDEEIIRSIAPIDLLIGGSPCNDLSIANPNRLGLHDPKGTGVLFFDYARIKELLIEANKGHHLFWLFENVASMPSSCRLAINQTLGRQPRLIDASDFSPQHRPRLFWSNLPIGVNFPPPDPSHYLQSALIPNCNRHALVKKICTVTTKVSSLKQGVSLLKPVLMNGEPAPLWITELEMIFGFPKHYTDVKNLSATMRQKLIGQAWSVQTITAILQPLRYFFLTKTSQSTN